MVRLSRFWILSLFWTAVLATAQMCAAQTVVPAPQNAPAQPAATQPAQPAATQQPAQSPASPSEAASPTAAPQIAAPQVPPDPCAAAAQAELCKLIETGQLADLRWPNFTDFRKDVKDFYVASGYALAWSAQNQPTPQARALITLLQQADNKGLRPEDYDVPRWTDRITQLSQTNPVPTANDWAKFDLEMTVSVMRYISDLHNGRVNPKYFQYGFDIEPKKYNLADFLRTKLLTATDVAAVLVQIEPANPAYQRTKVALEQYVALAKTGEGEPLPAVETKIKPGEIYAGLPQLAQRLRRLGDLPEDAAAPAATNVYDGDLVKAVKHFQKRHGLTPDGTIGADTFSQMVVPLPRRVVQLQLALERWRWLPTNLAPPMVVVNIPEFELHAYGTRRSISMKTVVGKALDRQTPVFDDMMRYVIFRPYWNVPESIVEKELLPAITKNKTYLDKHQYEIVNHKGEVIPADKVDAKVLRQLKLKQLDIRQKPGPTNSLGPVKFVFPNHYDVYLHGTPERGLFARSRRDFSHGCIRVEDPAQLAAWVLGNNPAWNMQHIREAMNAETPLQVNLPRPIPVLIMYGTATVEENGEVHFFDDVYGHDKQLEAALANGHPYPTTSPVAVTTDVPGQHLHE